MGRCLIIQNGGIQRKDDSDVGCRLNGGRERNEVGRSKLRAERKGERLSTWIDVDRRNEDDEKKVGCVWMWVCKWKGKVWAEEREGEEEEEK
jgi:hypothetical protein